MALEISLTGSLLMNGDEQDLFLNQSELLQYETKISFANLEAGDEIVIATYIKDEHGGSTLRYRTTHIEGQQTNPITVINWLATSIYRVSCEQITGTNRTINWALFTA